MRAVLSKETMQSSNTSSDEIDLADIWMRLRGRWRFILGTTVLVTVAAVAVAFLWPPVYEGKVVMLVAKDEQNSKLSGIAGMASQLGLGSIGLGLSGQSDRKAEAIATLQSRILTETYVKERNLLPVLFASKWDSVQKKWRSDDPDRQPSLWDANKLFEKKIRAITDDSKTGLVTLTIAWKDRRLAAQWANDLVSRTNDYLRQKALNESTRNLAYLNDQLKQTNVVELQQAIYGLIESEIKKTMMARGSDEYAFKVIDPAVIPEERSSPKRVLIIVLGLFAGLALGGVIAAFFLPLARRE